VNVLLLKEQERGRISSLPEASRNRVTGRETSTAKGLKKTVLNWKIDVPWEPRKSEAQQNLLLFKKSKRIGYNGKREYG